MPKIKRRRQGSSDSSSEDECLLSLSNQRSCNELAREYGIKPSNLLFESTSVACDLCDRLFTNRLGALVHNTKHIIIPLIRFKTLGEFYQYHTEELRQYTQEKQHHTQDNANCYTEDKNDDKHHSGDMICHKEDMIQSNEDTILDRDDIICDDIVKTHLNAAMIHHKEEFILPDYVPELPIDINNSINNEKINNIRSRIIFEDDVDEIIDISDDESVLNKITSDCKVNLGELMTLNKIVLGKGNTLKSNMKVLETQTSQKSNMKVLETQTSQKSNMKVLETQTSQKSNMKVLETQTSQKTNIKVMETQTSQKSNTKVVETQTSQKSNLKVLETLTSDCRVVISEALPFSLTDIVTNANKCNQTESTSVLNSFTSDCKVNLEALPFDEEILCDNEPYDLAVESLRLDLALEYLGMKPDEEKDILNTEVQTFEISDDDQVNGDGDVPNGDGDVPNGDNHVLYGDEDVPNGDENEEFESVHYDDLSIPSFHKCKFCWHTFPNRFDLIHHSICHLRLRPPPQRRCLLCVLPPLGADRKLPLCSACLTSVSRGRAHGVVECALCQTRLLTVQDLAGHLKTHYEKGKVYSRIRTMCEVCAVFADKNNSKRCGTFNFIRFSHVGDLKEIGARRRCDQCHRKCYIAKLYQKSRAQAPSLSHSIEFEREPISTKFNFEEPHRQYRKNNKEVKKKTISNTHRLKNIRQRLKIMKMV